VRAQIANTRIEPDTEARSLGDLVENAATREEINSHPDFVAALDRLQSIPETSGLPGFGTPEYRTSRPFAFDGEEVIGEAAALDRWVETAKRLASEETGVTYDGVGSDKTATIVLGPPAAGKSSIANEIAIAQRAAIIDADEIKKTIPEFEGGIGSSAVHEESSMFTDLLEETLRREGVNVVYPKVGAGAASIQRAIAAFKEAGYTVSIVNMEVTPENAYRRMVARFVATGRIILPEYVDAVGSKPTDTFQEIKTKGGADGFAQIDNNGARFDPKTISEIQGINPLAGTRFADDGSGGPRLQQADSGRPRPNEEVTPAGQQTLMAGIEPITERTRLDQRMSQPLGRSGAQPNDSQIGGLFDPNDPSRFDLFDAVPVARGFDDEGNEIAVVKSRADLAAELDADDEAVAVLDLCVKG